MPKPTNPTEDMIQQLQEAEEVLAAEHVWRDDPPEIEETEAESWREWEEEMEEALHPEWRCPPRE
jgi:hypothetical protein